MEHIGGAGRKGIRGYVFGFRKETGRLKVK
jgi:hypothetical protein